MLSTDTNAETDTTDTVSVTETKTDDVKINTDPLMSLYGEEMNKRNEQSMAWSLANNKNLPYAEKLKIYQGMIDQSKTLSGTRYKTELLKQIYPGNPSNQGLFIHCPIDIHKGSFVHDEDRYTYIYGEEVDRKIRDNCNNNLFQQINGTEITQGMMKRAEGNKWLNGIIVYNKNSIVVRDPDNDFGQPGFLKATYYYDKLGVEVMNRYIIPKLIKEVNEKTINPKEGYDRSVNLITETYEKVYQDKIMILNQNNIEHINELTLFEDAQRAEKLNTSDVGDSDAIKRLTRIIDEKDKRIDVLEKKVESLNSKLNLVLTKIIDLEEIYLDLSIRSNKQ
jgi:hypothetical protein